MADDNAKVGDTYAIAELLRNMHPEVRIALETFARGRKTPDGREMGLKDVIEETQEYLGKVPFPSRAAQDVLVERAHKNPNVNNMDATLLSMLRSPDSVESAEKEAKARSAVERLAAREPAALIPAALGR